MVVAPSVSIFDLADKIASFGVKEKDSLHIACAIEAESDYFLTTDKRLLNKTIDGIKIINPVDFILTMGVEK